MSSHKPWTIALLAGGDSDEAVISHQSGAAVHQALASRGHTVVPLDPAVVNLHGVDWSPFDVAFLALHGRFGEDGQVQDILQRAGIPFTGSDAATSRLSFSKSAAKERLFQFELPTPNYVLLHATDSPDRLRRMVDMIGYPLVIKPDTQGSSLGVTIVRTPAEIERALADCFAYDRFGIAEEYVAGTEWTVGVLDELVFPPIRIETQRPFFDYQAKYLDDDTRYEFDSDWSATDLAQIQDVAVAAARALGTRGLARVDLRADLQRRPWVLEINTIPGLTDHSLVPKAAARIGIEFAELCERMIEACWHARPARPHYLQIPRVSPASAFEGHSRVD